MSAYLIFTRDKTLNEHELASYLKEVQSTSTGHEAKVLAFYGSHEDLEGASTEGAVILEFPSVGAAKAWYNSPPYRTCVSIVSEGRYIGSHWWLECEELEPLTVHPEWPNRKTGDSRVEETF
jgi:uncharacterized protein (DUF1330 family)